MSGGWYASSDHTLASSYPFARRSSIHVGCRQGWATEAVAKRLGFTLRNRFKAEVPFSSGIVRAEDRHGVEQSDKISCAMGSVPREHKANEPSSYLNPDPSRIRTCGGHVSRPRTLTESFEVQSNLQSEASPE